MYQTILVVEDDPMQLDQLEKLLTESAYYVIKAGGYDRAKSAVVNEQFDLLLLDLRLGDRSGMEILSLVKRIDEKFPVVILSSLTDVGKKVSAFETGVDDYVTKPYHPAELILRIRRLLKDREVDADKRLTEIIMLGDVEFDVANGIIKNGSQQFFLRRKVLEFLLFLYKNRNCIVSKEQILASVWDNEAVDENVISVTVHEIRKMIEADPKKPRTVMTAKGLGYKLVV